MRLQTTCYRAHDPRWSFKPLSGAGAAIRGGRFNAKNQPALYLSFDIITAIKEANQGFAHKIDPCVLCSYQVDCDDILDLTAEHQFSPEDLACPWFELIRRGKEPPSWKIARQLQATGHAGIIVPSFAAGATSTDRNLVLWHWADHPPHQISIDDPSGRLPRDQLSWR